MNNSIKNIFIFLFPLVYIPYLCICIYNHPNADDFVYGFLSQTKDFYPAWSEQYNTWSGRYSANIFVLLGPLKWGSFTMYKFIPAMFIFLMWCSLYYLQINLLEKILDKKTGIIITHLIVLLFLYNMPILSEGLYWYTGAVTYLMGCIFFVFYTTLLIQFYKGKYMGKKLFIHIIPLTIILLFCIGFNEVLMLLIVIFNLAICIVAVKHSLKNNRFSIYLLAISILGALLVLMAPGNTVRGNEFTQSHQFIHSLGFSLAQTIRFLGLFILSPVLWILSFVWIFIHRKLMEQSILFKNHFYLHRYVSLLLLPLIIFICVFPAYWATGILGQHRTLNVAYWFFIFMWFINLSVWYSHWQKKLSTIQLPKRKTIIILSVLSFGSFLFVKNGFYCTMDLFTGRAQRFNIEMEKRYTLMKTTNDTITFTPIKNVPKTISFYEVTDDPNNWLNACWISYFGKEGKAIAVKKQTSE